MRIGGITKSQTIKLNAFIHLYLYYTSTWVHIQFIIHIAFKELMWYNVDIQS